MLANNRTTFGEFAVTYTITRLIRIYCDMVYRWSAVKVFCAVPVQTPVLGFTVSIIITIRLDRFFCFFLTHMLRWNVVKITSVIIFLES